MLFLVRGEDLVELNYSSFRNENEFREYFKHIVEQNPVALLVAREMKGKPGLLIGPILEFDIDGGSIDVLFIDDEYWIYIVETKLYRSSERRHAISQALDYASALWCKDERKADEILMKIENKIGRKFSKEERTGIKESLLNGNFEIIVAFDNIDERIKRIVDFINETTEFDIFAVKLEKIEADDTTILNLLLYPEEKPEVSRSSKKKFIWDEDSFMKRLEEKTSREEFEAIRNFYKKLREIFNQEILVWGTGASIGTFKVRIKNFSEKYDSLSIDTEGKFWLSFKNMYGVTEEYDQILDTFSEELYNHNFLKVKIDHTNYNEEGKRYPSISLKDNIEKLEELVNILRVFYNNIIKQQQD